MDDDISDDRYGSGAEPDVFICYRRGRADATAALLRMHLDRRDIVAFVDRDGIEPGEQWARRIRAVIASRQLAVGVVLMHGDWFTELADRDGRDDPVRDEVVQLLERSWRNEIGLVPVYIAPPGAGGELPEAPDEAAEDVVQLRAAIEVLHCRRVEETASSQAMAQLAEEVVAEVIRRGRNVDVLDGMVASDVPPQPLVRLYQDARLRRRLLNSARADEADLATLEREALLAQSDILRRDFDAARDRLRRVWRPPAVRRAADGCVDVASARAAIWYNQAANLLAIATMRGERPRRLKMADAICVYRDYLLEGLVVHHDVWWMRGPVPDLGEAWERSARYVWGFADALVDLVGRDYFARRNVELPLASEHRLDLLAPARRSARSAGHRGSGLEEEKDFVAGSYLDGIGAGSRFLALS